MAPRLSINLALAYIIILVVFCHFELCFSFKSKKFNLSTIETHWSSAGATWYGSPDGAGIDGGSCGYGNAVSLPPFSSMVTGIGPSLYKTGKECGACYQVRTCSLIWILRLASLLESCKLTLISLQFRPISKLIACLVGQVYETSLVFWPRCLCASDSAHFDLSGTAFGAMAIVGQEAKLRDAGVLEIRYARVDCDYSGKKIAFQVDLGSNSNYFAMLVEFEDGDGDLAGVYLEASSRGSGGDWRAMQQSWGAVWKLDAGSELHPPFSIRLSSQYSGKTLVAKNVIPQGWQPGATYRSLVNYL
ncbi:hypothetical protein REPUB_Repub08aG0007300 [Reevesia pubescens]